MRHLMKTPLLLLWLAAPAVAAECPPAPDVTEELQGLFEEARAAEDFRQGRAVSGKMWEVWLRAPDAAAQEVLDAGMARRDAYDFIGADAEFNRLVAYCPEYAEGYNQRAYIAFLQDRPEAALADLDIALKLQPNHVAAQSGRALTLMKLDRLEEARAQLLIAVENNPWLSEAALLADGAPLGPKGKDI
jgi:tetratricopeptide (TPR) repeat protein